MANKIRVLHLTSSLKIGGAETVLVSLLRVLQNRKIDNLSVRNIPSLRQGFDGLASGRAGDNLSDSDGLIWDNSVLYFHAGPNLLELEKLGITAIQIRGKYHQYDPWFFWRCYQAIKQAKPDVIHSSLWLANFMGRLFGKLLNLPVIATIHSPVNSNGADAQINSLNTKKLPQHLGILSNSVGMYRRTCDFRTVADNFTAHWAQYTVAVSASTAHQVQQAWLKLNHNILVIPNGIEISRAGDKYSRTDREVIGLASLETSVLQSNYAQVLANLKPDNFVIGTVGRLVASKNYGNLITSFANLRAKYTHLILVIIGSGELEQALKAQAQKLNLADKIFFIQTTQALAYYKYFDCFVQPSYYEGLSMALLEAGLFKLPVVASYNYNLKHDVIVDQQNGLLIDPYVPEQLELALAQLILAPELRARLGRNLFKTVAQDFSLENMVTGYEKLYLNCVSKPPTP